MNSNIKDIYSLTPTQEGIYAQYFQNTDTKTYHLQNLSRISKETDLDILKKSVELLSLRHQVLKTAFTVLKSTGAIKQVILENRKPKFSIIPQEEPFSKNALDKIISEDIKKTLDLQRDSLLRVAIVDFTDERFMFIHTHHIILDGWCFAVIINDLQKYYGELSKGTSVEELSNEINKEVSAHTSYAQYVNWLKNQDKNEALGYWQNLLVDYVPAHIFSKEKKYNAKNEDIVTFKTCLNDEVSQRIEYFAKESKVSHNTVFESAFSIALQKYSGSEDIVFDKVISGRSIPLKNIEKTVGTFINTVPVRIRSAESSTLADLLKEIQNQTINANKYGILPLAEVYKVCGIDNKSIDALFVFENYYTGDSSDIEAGPLSPKLISFDEQTEFNLTVTILKENNGYTVRTSYAKEMYSERDISSFIKGYISILESSLDGTKQIKDISVTDMSVVNKFNDTAHNYDVPDNSTIYSLFEKTAKANDDKMCIKTSEKEFSFRELLNVSESLDGKIRSITGNKKSIVAVIAERSVEMYGAIYGIIRGGNAYLPIDPDYPQDRIEYILQNSETAVVVAQGKFIDLAGKVPCIDMTELLNNTPYKQTEVPACIAEPEDTAYVIYTSGSTGTPKGAKVSHRSAVNRILWMHDKYPLGTDDVILQKTPYTFDVSVWEVFWWGMCGGCLAASKPGEHFLPAKILDEVSQNKVTHLHFVPSVFELFLNYLEEHKAECNKFDSVRYVFLSGEALTENLVNRFYKLYDYSKVTLHNLYGPTECAVDVTYYDCTPEDIDPVPIGKPIYNTQMYVVDKHNNSVPVGVTGELCIAGKNVGQGYINNAEQTAEKFIDNTFGEGKLYKTGDLAYFREDGNIVFCGRKDSQIKLNGQRIETGEIDTVISAISGVEKVAVIIRKINQRDVLVAFYCGKTDMEIKIKDICRVKLPKYMVPSFVVHVDEMPLNPSGKLDRKVLAKTEITIYSSEVEMPINDTERYICKVFEDILGEKNIGRNGDFFEMGGTSYSMISLLSADGFETITAAEFMRNPTPALLASLLKKKAVQEAEYLEALYIPENPKQTLILLPFAGGGAEAYSNFIVSLKKCRNDIAVYFIRYLHSMEECRKAANEIADFFKDTEILFYSHCVGSAVALNIISCLEKDNIQLKQYFAAASIPPAKPSNKNTWNYVPDRLLKRTLLKAGAKFDKLSDKDVSLRLKQFRKDTDFAVIGFAKFEGKITVPVSIIISKKDAFTKNYEQADILWRKYADNVVDVCYINSDSHYFQSDNSNELIEIIFRDI